MYKYEDIGAMYSSFEELRLSNILYLYEFDSLDDFIIRNYDLTVGFNNYFINVGECSYHV